MEHTFVNMESPLAVANFFIKCSLSSGEELTPMKLVKLCYIAHGWHLAYFNNELLPEAVYAWKYGPVVSSVYHQFKNYYTNQIMELQANQLGEYPLPDEEIQPFLKSVWDAYKKYNGIQLSTLTHQPNTPWDIVWNQQNGKAKKDVIIPNDLIKEYYMQKLKKFNPTA